MKTLFKVGKTYAKVTPESCENGDYSETGWEFESTDYNLRDLLHGIKLTGIDNISHYGGHASIYGYNFTSNYRTNEKNQYCLHIDTSKRVMKRLLKIIDPKGVY